MQVYKTNLKNAIQCNNRHEINQAIKAYKAPDGRPNFPALLEIPSPERIPAMASKDMAQTAALITVVLTTAMDSLNLKRPMTPVQILDLTDAVIDSASEDNLSIEDLVLFLQKFTRGEYGSFYESMDMAKFLQIFEEYREQRHQTLLNIRDEQNAKYSIDRTEPRNSDELQREESIKNVAALVEYSKHKANEKA